MAWQERQLTLARGIPCADSSRAETDPEGSLAGPSTMVRIISKKMHIGVLAVEKYVGNPNQNLAREQMTVDILKTVV